jgi:hypothetical protein
MNSPDFAARQSDLAWGRVRNRRCCAVVTDPCAFAVSASIRRVASEYGLPQSAIPAAARVAREELDRTDDVFAAMDAGMRALVMLAREARHVS